MLALPLTLAVLVGACAEVPTDLDELRQSAERGVEQLREQTDGLLERDAAGGTQAFCLVVTRAVTAIESGAGTTAREAAEELLARAPGELQAEAEQLVEEIRARGGEDLDDQTVRDAAEDLRRAADDWCAA